MISWLNLHLGNAARLFRPAEHAWFVNVSAALHTHDWDVALQWNTLAKITAMTGVAPDRVGEDAFGSARAEMLAAYRDRGLHGSGRNLAAIFHRLQLTLFHEGRVTTLRKPARHPPVSVTGWSAVTPLDAVMAQAASS